MSASWNDREGLMCLQVRIVRFPTVLVGSRSEQVMVSSTFQVRALLVNPFEPTGWLTGQEEPERIASCVIG